MTRISTRLLGVCASIGVAAAAFLCVSSPASAEPMAGLIEVVPSSGPIDAPIDLKLARTCDHRAPNYQVVVVGEGFPTDGYNVTGNAPIASVTDQFGNIRIPLLGSLKDAAYDQPDLTRLKGDYTFIVKCREKLQPTVYGEYSVTIKVDSTGRNFAAVDSVAVATKGDGSSSDPIPVESATGDPVPSDPGTASADPSTAPSDQAESTAPAAPESSAEPQATEGTVSSDPASGNGQVEAAGQGTASPAPAGQGSGSQSSAGQGSVTADYQTSQPSSFPWATLALVAGVVLLAAGVLMFLRDRRRKA